ncbi:hypothetical protein H2198_010435 [Neophaeococcomyces mojaviensis]|uniref:Uncharacterized protein n=1 Tax=Neophaeococcomyces mojaviensis TaxID=3383035 RepID=A0ACC2ZRK2_9EURO|nr:hypothetical protein H2198_010435 [Knufia sp. JES_112]
MRVLLTGTSGNLGSRVLHSLLHYSLIPTSDLVVSTRSPHKIAAVAKQNSIHLVSGDFTDPASLNSSFAESNADILFLVSFPSPSVDRWLHHKNAIDAAKQSGCIKLIVYTSLMFGGETGMSSVAGVQQAHIRTVGYLAGCGLDYLVVREGIYAESWWLYAGFQSRTIAESGEPLTFVIPNDGPVAWVTWDDLGEGTARILAKLVQGERQWIGKTLNLTGPRTATITDIARLVERYSGRTVEVKCVGKEEAERYHLRDGKKEEWLVNSWVGWFDAIRDGECAVVDSLLEELLGRPPRGVEELAEEMFAVVGPQQ